MPPKKKIQADERIYDKLSDREHALTVPDMYLGSLDKLDDIQWVFDDQDKKFTMNAVKYSPALYKIYDEICVNARDQYTRYPDLVNTIKFNYDAEKGYVSVLNNGPGFEVYYDDKEDMYSVQLVLTETKSGSNFKTKDKTTGGKYGLGSKLTVIFSKYFKIETVDVKRKLKYEQVYKNNLDIIEEPKITKFSNKPFTRITFIPDYQKFGMKGLKGEDIIKLFEKRAYDMAACTEQKVKVYLNDELLPVRNFNDYVNLYIGSGPRVYSKVNDRWEICIADSNFDEFAQVSFVNGVNTFEGGTHVDYITNAITRKIKQKLVDKNEKFKAITPNMIKNHIFIFINSIINDPSFGSQTKGRLVTEVSKFGSKCNIDDDVIDKIGKKLTIVAKSINSLTAKDQLNLEKTSGKVKARVNVPKLVDANNAGKKGKSQDTYLILTEGDSAKAFAMAGRSVVGPDNFGVFPLRGKLINVRRSSMVQVAKNAEMNYLKEILGLVHGKVYKDVSELRYGHILILTDADVDGSHIKGLIINFIHHYWPSLLNILKINDAFLDDFITPMIKAVKGNGKNKQVKEFFAKSQYENWKDSLEDGELKKWDVKYYKGMATTNAIEAREYFSRFYELVRKYKYNGKKDDSSLALAFDKGLEDKRKEWLKKYDPNAVFDYSQDEISISDFVNKELIHFSTDDNARSIPNIMDGLKPSQRKIIFGAFKKNITKDIKVAQLAPYVSENTQYHHGEVSLQETIIGMAQDFVGSNNIELLFPSGMFGTRLLGGKDAGQARYIFTRFAMLTKTLFNEKDFPLLNYLEDEGYSIEPNWYVPVIPLVLCNGVVGIGTGYSTNIPSYNPRDIINNIKKLLDGDKPDMMHPWYRNFTGEIKKIAAGKYISKGKYEIVKDGVIRITELPIGVWTTPYKETFLEEISVSNKDAKRKLITRYDDNCSDVSIDLTLYFVKSEFDKIKKLPKKNGCDGFEQSLKLISPIATTNMHLFDKNNVITKYNSPVDIIKEYYPVRLAFYQLRKKYILAELKKDLMVLEAKVKFIKLVIEDKIIINKRKKVDLIADIKKHDIPPKNDKNKDDKNDNDNEIDNDNDNLQGYGYLIKMPIYNLTEEKIKEFMAEFKKKKNEFNKLKELEPEDLYRIDLDEFEKEYDQFEKYHQAKFATMKKQPQTLIKKK